jgi:uncharacterized RDD family membrane protein YckC
MMKEKTCTLPIRTPEGIAFSLLLAGPITRFLAWAIDVACVVGAAGVSQRLLGVAGIVSFDLSRALSILAYFLILIGYGIGTEWFWRGQTIGKRLLRLRVMDIRGLRLRPDQIVIRNLMRIVDGLPLFYVIGGVACLLSGRAQRLGDLAANTIVVRNPKIADPDLDQLLSGKYNSLREHRHLCARLRQRATPRDAAIAVQALLRRDELEPEARVELFGRVASHFRSLVEFPEEALHGVGDEQYVRNAAEIVLVNEKSGGKSGRL